MLTLICLVFFGLLYFIIVVIMIGWIICDIYESEFTLILVFWLCDSCDDTDMIICYINLSWIAIEPMRLLIFKI